MWEKKNRNFWVSWQKNNTKTLSDKYISSTANGLLPKPRHYITTDLLKAIYFSVFNSHTRNAWQVWAQSKNVLLTQIGKSQNKALRLLNFEYFMETSNPTYRKLWILKLEDVLLQNNCPLVYDWLAKKSLNNFW